MLLFFISSANSHNDGILKRMKITIHGPGGRSGPFPEGQVKQLLSEGRVSPADLGWTDGMSEWVPLSQFPGLNDVTPPPIPPAVAKDGSRTAPMAIWSLCLGIFSFVACTFGGFIPGIAAVVLGHISRSNIRKNPELSGSGLALSGLILGYLSLIAAPFLILIALALPAATGALERGQAELLQSQMRMVHLAVEQAQLDGTTTGDSTIGYPASAKLNSKTELRNMLVSNGYLTDDDFNKLNFGMMNVANIPESAPGDTIFLIGTSPKAKFTVIIYRDGSSAVYPTKSVVLPDELPAFLE